MIGALGMIDEGEMDWKLFAIALDDPLCGRIEGARCIATSAIPRLHIAA